MCELLVIRGLTKRIVLTRLPVGHTHEDIDARFALIWKRAQLAHLLTISQYSRMAISATSVNCPFPSNVIDIYAVPDYDFHLRPCIDKKFGRYAKEEVTQLQFIFEAVEPNNFFPFGVKSTYRSYCNNKVVEIVEDNHYPCRFVEKFTDVFTYPMARRYQKGFCLELQLSAPRVKNLIITVS